MTRKINPGWDLEAKRLAGHIPEPRIKNKVLDYMRQANMPVLFREILSATGVHRAGAIRVLDRAVKAGIVERWKVPVSCHLPNPHGDRRPIPGGATRQLYLYQIVEGK